MDITNLKLHQILWWYLYNDHLFLIVCHRNESSSHGARISLVCNETMNVKDTQFKYLNVTEGPTQYYVCWKTLIIHFFQFEMFTENFYFGLKFVKRLSVHHVSLKFCKIESFYLALEKWLCINLRQKTRWAYSTFSWSKIMCRLRRSRPQ